MFILAVFGNVLSFFSGFVSSFHCRFCVFFYIFLSSFGFGYIAIVVTSCCFQFFYCFNVLGLNSFFGIGQFVVGALSSLATQTTVGPPFLYNHL